MSGPGDSVPRRPIAIALAIGLVLLAAAVAAALSHRSVHPAATNGIASGQVLLTRAPGARGTDFCQAGEHVPAGAAELRVSLGSLSSADPRIALTLRDRGGTVRASGGEAARWSRHAVVVPLRGGALARDVAGRVCVRLAPTAAGQRVRFYGQQPEGEAAEAGAVQSAQVRIEYLYAGEASWWRFGGTVADRLGRGHAISGRSVALLVVLLALLSIGVAAWQLVRRDADA